MKKAVVPKKKSTRSVNKGDGSILRLVTESRPVIDDKTLGKLLRKAKTGRGKRHLQSKEPQVREETKLLLLLKGHHTNQRCTDLLRDLARVRAPFSIFLKKRNQDRLMEPMDKPDDFVYLGERNNSSLFAMASSTKKRPFRLYLGRLFDDALYDLFEFDVRHYEGLSIDSSLHAPIEGAKPIVIFQGSSWDSSMELLGAKSIFADIFGGIRVENIRLEGINDAYSITAYEDTTTPSSQVTLIRVDHFHVKLKKNQARPSAEKTPDSSVLPDVEIVRIGPTLILQLARARLPSPELEKKALRIPDEEFEKGGSKLVTNDLQETRAKIHFDIEDVSKLRLLHGSKSSKKKKRTTGHNSKENPLRDLVQAD